MCIYIYIRYNFRFRMIRSVYEHTHISTHIPTHIPTHRGVGTGGGGAGGIGPPHSKIWGGAKYVLPPPMNCVLINFIYIKSSILSLLIQIFFKECYQTYGGGLSIVPPPSMKNDNIHERISERYLLSGAIKNAIIQQYKSELLNILWKD